MAKRINTKYWAIKKWEWIVENWDYKVDLVYNLERMEKVIPRLKRFESHCSYCHIHKTLFRGCQSCPLHDSWIRCCEEYSSWSREIHTHFFSDAGARAGKKAAEAMLARIKAL